MVCYKCWLCTRTRGSQKLYLDFRLLGAHCLWPPPAVPGSTVYPGVKPPSRSSVHVQVHNQMPQCSPKGPCESTRPPRVGAKAPVSHPPPQHLHARANRRAVQGRLTEVCICSSRRNDEPRRVFESFLTFSATCLLSTFLPGFLTRHLLDKWRHGVGSSHPGLTWEDNPVRGAGSQGTWAGLGD